LRRATPAADGIALARDFGIARHQRPLDAVAIENQPVLLRAESRRRPAETRRQSTQISTDRPASRQISAPANTNVQSSFMRIFGLMNMR